MKRFLCASSAVLLVLSAHGALARDESKPAGPDEIVVYGRAIDAPELPPLDAVTLIGRDEIERQAPMAAVELLRERAGVDVRGAGGPGKQTSVFLRGSASDQVRVLIDGVPVGSTTTGAFDWPYLSTQDIDRIEVHRGPQSALYGSAAMGGVIQIFTRRADEEGVRGAFRAGFGNLGQRQVAIRLAGRAASGLGATFSAEHATTNGVSAADVDPAIDPDPETDPFRNTSVSTSFTVPIGEASLDVFYRRADAQTEIDGFGPSDAVTPEQDTIQAHFGADLRVPVTGYWTTRLLVSKGQDDLFGHDTDPFAAFDNFELESTRHQVSWTNDVRMEAFTFVGGVDLEKDRTRSVTHDFFGVRTTVQEGTRRIGGFGVLRYEGDGFGFEAGGRYEFNDRTDDEFTYQLAGHVTLAEGLDAVASFGTAFRAPDLNELFFPNFGNLGLDPERSHGGDIGLRLSRTLAGDVRLTGEVRAFHNSYEDLILFAFPGGFVNLDRSRTSGAEVVFRLDRGDVWIGGNYTFLDGRDADGAALIRRARHAGRLSVGGRWRGFTAEAVLHVVGKTFDAVGEGRPVDSYVTADLHLTADVRENLRIGLNLRNLSNHGYQEVFGFGTLPRTYLLSAEVRF